MSGIEWTGVTWNPITGCTEVSPGCDHCYARTFAERWRGTPGHHFERGFDVQLRPERLRLPLTWRSPRLVFVNSMSDLFHDQVPDEFIADVFAVMTLAWRHSFQVLTKRPGRMRSLLNDVGFWAAVWGRAASAWSDDGREWPLRGTVPGSDMPANIWLGVSAEDQRWAAIRLPALAAVPAAVRFVSAEPLLGPLDLAPWLGQLDWVITGGESGPGARPMELAWAASLASQCRAAAVPVFVKQLGAVLGRQLGAGTKGGNLAAWPPGLRVRQFPAATPPVLLAAVAGGAR